MENNLSKAKRDSYKACLSRWFRFYEIHQHTKPTYGAMEGKHMKQLIGKIRSKVKEHGGSEKDIPDTFEHILKIAYGMKWVSKNFSLPIINSKFDIIFAHGKSKSTSTAEAYLDKLNRAVNKGK